LPVFSNLQEELEQWLAAARQKEEDSLALERYRRQDDARVKELGMQLEAAARRAHQAQRDLEDEATETQVGWRRWRWGKELRRVSGIAA
jgi:predicted RNase H-like nuclease (RuvC/YqgF family)